MGDSHNMEPVKDLRLEKGMTVENILRQMHEGGGFTAKNLQTGADIFKRMVEEKDCFNFLSFPACTISTGMRGVIRDLVKEKKVDAIITTCGMLDHDFARIWKDYYHGTFHADDGKLRKEGISRLGNIFVPDESYGLIIEEKLRPIIERIYHTKNNLGTKEFIWMVGEAIKDEERAEESIIYWAWKNQIPVFVPGITDGAFGFQIFMFWQDHTDLNINLMKDERDLCDIVYTHKKTGALMLGGGISKHHTIWWNQFKEGLDYAVYITTAVEYDGSLSGARLEEAISWGKLKPDAKKVNIEGDATIILPLIVAAVM
ncbi:MAG: deoxyhypusine synthase [Candidatus Aenigmatarchaeota archaeon]